MLLVLIFGEPPLAFLLKVLELALELVKGAFERHAAGVAAAVRRWLFLSRYLAWGEMVGQGWLKGLRVAPVWVDVSLSQISTLPFPKAYVVNNICCFWDSDSI